LVTLEQYGLSYFVATTVPQTLERVSSGLPNDLVAPAGGWPAFFLQNRQHFS
jgi:hypothetical protein